MTPLAALYITFWVVLGFVGSHCLAACSGSRRSPGDSPTLSSGDFGQLPLFAEEAGDEPVVGT